MTDFLFHRSSFFNGMSRVLDLFGVYDRYNTSTNAQEADSRAIQNDWSVVGSDLADAIENYKGGEALIEPFPRHKDKVGI